MITVALKYELFGESEKAKKELQKFMQNFEIIQTGLGQIEECLIDATDNSSHEINKKIVNINKEITSLLNNKSVVFGAPSSKSILLSYQQRNQITSWTANKKKQNLLYRASRDGFNAQDFHRTCDNKGGTIVVIKSNNGWLFGGYTTVSWNQSGRFVQDSQSFLFTLTNPHNIPPTKYPISNAGTDNAIYCSSDYGPTFGGGHDIYIASFANTNTGNYCNFPSSYQDTTGRGNATFTGQRNGWTVSDIEVFGFE